MADRRIVCQSSGSLKGKAYLPDLPEAGDILVDADGNQIVFNNLYGEFYIADGDEVTTTIATALTFQKAAGTTTAGLLNGFTHSNGRLTYTGSITRVFHVICAFTCDSDDTDIYHFVIAVNGVVSEKTEQHRRIAGGDIRGAVSVQGLFSLSTNDFFEIFVTSATVNSAGLTLEHQNMIIR